MTWRDLVRSSLRMLPREPGANGAIGRSPTGSELIDAKFVLAAMVDGWSILRRAVFIMRADLFTLTVNQKSFTIGPGGNFNITPRPVRIVRANIVFNDVTPVVRRPMAVISDEEWALIRVQDLPGSVPLKLYYDGSFDANSRGTVWIWPQAGIAYQIELWTPQQITQVTDLSTTVLMPPGYADAIRYNLAVRLGEEWNRPVNARVESLANQTKAAIESQNARQLRMVSDFPSGSHVGGFNYRTGDLA